MWPQILSKAAADLFCPAKGGGRGRGVGGRGDGIVMRTQRKSISPAPSPSAYGLYSSLWSARVYNKTLWKLHANSFHFITTKKSENEQTNNTIFNNTQRVNKWLETCFTGSVGLSDVLLSQII